MSVPAEPLAWQLFDAEQYEDALPLLRQLNREEADVEQKIQILDAVGFCCVETKQQDQAIESYTAILELRPDDIDTLINIGTMFGRKGNRAEAIKHYQMSVEAGNTDRDDLFFLAQLYTRSGHFQEARDTLEVLIKHHPEDALAYELIGIIEEERNDYVPAALAYKQAIDLGREDDVLAKRIATILLKMQQFEVAKNAIALVLEDDPEDAAMIYHLAVAEYLTNDLEGAIEHLKQAIRIQPDFPFATTLLQEIQSKFEQAKG